MQDWWDVLRVNLLGPALGCHVVLPGMLARGRGRIVTIGSLTGADPNATFTSYAVSKAAVMRPTDSLTMSLSGTGVLVFELNPGLVHTTALDAHPDRSGWDPGHARPASFRLGRNRPDSR